MKHIILLLLPVLIFEQYSYSQKQDDSAKERNKPSYTAAEKTDFFDFTLSFGVDNNNDLMTGGCFGYIHTYEFIGFGINAGLYVMKNFFLMDDVSEMEIPHHDYRVSDFENRGALTCDLLGSLNYGGIFLSGGASFLVLVRNNFYISNITGWKWKGERETGSFAGFKAQIQYFVPQGKNSRYSYTIGAEAKYFKDAGNFFAFKFGIGF